MSGCVICWSCPRRPQSTEVVTITTAVAVAIIAAGVAVTTIAAAPLLPHASTIAANSFC